MKNMTCVALLGLLLATAGWAAAQTAGRAEVLLEAAQKKELVSGDLNGAIRQYREIVAKYPNNRMVAAKALIRIGQCYEKMGDTESRKAYEEVLSAYADQTEAASEARSRLAALARPGSPATGAADTSTRLVWKVPNGHPSGRVSPDGRFLAFTDWDTNDLAVRDLATGRNRRITHNDPDSLEYPFNSIVSPDCKKIAYGWYNKNATYDVRIIGIEDSKPKVVLTDKAEILPLDWSPNGKQLLIGIDEQLSDGPAGLVLIDLNDGARRKVSPTWSLAAFSPDGRFIACSVEGGINLFEMATGKNLPLIQHSAKYQVLAWTLDGKYLLFRSNRSGTMDAWMVAISDGKVLGAPVLVKKNFEDRPVGITRAGSLYSATSRWVTDALIAEVNPATGQVVTPVQPASRQWIGITDFPGWSPDGRYLAYVRNGSAEQAMIIRNTDTGEERELKIRTGKINKHTPHWSAEGKSILIPAIDAGKGPSLMRIDTQSGEAIPLMPWPRIGVVEPFELSPDGNKVYFIAADPADPKRMCLRMRDLQSGQESMIHQQEGFYSFGLSPDGHWLAVKIYDLKNLTLFYYPCLRWTRPGTAQDRPAGGQRACSARLDGRWALRALRQGTPWRRREERTAVAGSLGGG